MTIEVFKRRRDVSLPRRLSVWLCRLSAIALFGVGIAYWVRLVGIFDGSLWRFDLMPLQWRMAAPALAVLCPVAGVGLWMPVSWGIVVWVVAAMIEAFLVFGLPQGLAAHPAILGGHALALSLLLALALTDRILRRRADTV